MIHHARIVAPVFLARDLLRVSHWLRAPLAARARAALRLVAMLAVATGSACDKLPDAVPAEDAALDGVSDEHDVACGQPGWRPGTSGMEYTDGCDTVMTLRPRLLIGETWLEPSTCEAIGPIATCEVDGYGSFAVQGSDDGVLLEAFHATADVTVGGLELVGTARVDGAKGWLSNGFQSWSSSGMLRLGPQPSEGRLRSALAKRGDPEVIRDGDELSWFYTAVGGGSDALVVGVLTTAFWHPWIQVWQEAPNVVGVRLGNGGTGESVPMHAGETRVGERWFVARGADSEALLEAWAERLVTRRTAVQAPAEAGWNSWYQLWDAVDEDAVRTNATRARALLQPLLPAGAPPLRIVVDDGWQAAWGEWTPNDKFPSGLDGLAADLRAEGFEVGVWLAPLLVDADSDLVAEHPDWFVPDAIFTHSKHGAMRILDVTHPEAAEHLRAAVAQLRDWGMTLLKIDFLFVGTWEGTRFEPVTGMEAYARALAVMREAVGDDVVLLAVGAPGVPSLPWVDAWRLGPDIAFEPFGPGWTFVVDEARSVSARWPLCSATLCDADPPLLRVLTQNEVEAGVWVAALAGGAFFLSDDLRVLDQERASWGPSAATLRLGLAGQPAVPQGVFEGELPQKLVVGGVQHVFERNEAFVPLRWRLPDGRTLLLNTTDETQRWGGTAVPMRSAAVAAP